MSLLRKQKNILTLDFLAIVLHQAKTCWKSLCEFGSSKSGKSHHVHVILFFPLVIVLFFTSNMGFISLLGFVDI